jgi:hypothetical protein
MDVSAVIREVEPAVDPSARTAPVRRRREDAPQPRNERHADPSTDRAPAPPPRTRHIDPHEGVAERASAGINQRANARVAEAAADPASSEELWIPGWVRITYASRARRGWFLPAPTTLAGYGEEDDVKQ